MSRNCFVGSKYHMIIKMLKGLLGILRGSQIAKFAMIQVTMDWLWRIGVDDERTG